MIKQGVNKNTSESSQKKVQRVKKITRPIAKANQKDLDQALIAKIKAGNIKAYDLLVAKYQGKLARLLSRFIRDSAEIEDVVQETFIKAYRALPSFRGDSAFYTWLYRIGINTAKNYLVSANRRTPTTQEFDVEDAESYEQGDYLHDVNTPENILISKQVVLALNDAVESLPGELKTAIALRELDGLSYEEIAHHMDCPIGTVRSRIFRARGVIAEKLDPRLLV